MQLPPATPSRALIDNEGGGTIVIARNNCYDSYNFAISTNDENNALVPVQRTPILSSILPKSTIKQFEVDVLRRQAEYTTRITDLEVRLAMFHTKLAIECAERGREHAFTASEYVDEPIEQAMRRSLELIETEYVRPIMDPTVADFGANQAKYYIGKTGVANEESIDLNDVTGTATAPHKFTNLVSIERRTNHLEDQMNHHRNVTLFHSRRENFDAIDKECRQTLQPSLALEMTKADKREGGMVRRFDSNAGEFTRVLMEMTSSRVSSLGCIERRLENWDISDSTRAKQYLEEIRLMKDRVIDLRRERIRQDESVVEKIMQTKKVLEEDIFLAC
ncbi:hypothetical protein ACHAXA_004392 [Cyclostephanos tholiformis]|uniref:Tektin n=1 Tax=Cyclostephanos tholiformis TaxID=382380 RepID=A0ABD3RF91_9STRA